MWVKLRAKVIPDYWLLLLNKYSQELQTQTRWKLKSLCVWHVVVHKNIKTMGGCKVFIEMACRRPQKDRQTGCAEKKKSRSQATHGKCLRRRRNFYWPCGETNHRRMSYAGVSHLFLRSVAKNNAVLLLLGFQIFFLSSLATALKRDGLCEKITES